MCKLMGYQPEIKYRLYKIKTIFVGLKTTKTISPIKDFSTIDEAEKLKFRLTQLDIWTNENTRYIIKEL